jgi:hypothetical protein
VRRALAVVCLVVQGTGALAWAAEGDPVEPPADPVLVGAGGIASCDTVGDEATAALIDDVIEEHPDARVFTAGDNAYETGTATQFAECYDKTWGKFKDRTHPASGNHDHATSGAAPYYSYFGAAAGEKGKGWYSYDLGAWHIVSLNSNCKHSSKCAPDSEQVRWLKADLAASNARCTAAVIHHPRFSSDKTDGSMPHVDPLWDVLYAAGADLVISGHARVYERFAPQTPDGVADPEYGMPLFNVGTGGRGYSGFDAPVPNSVVREGTSFGVLKLTLHAGSFDYEFLPVPGETFADAGTGACHDKPEGSVEEPTPPAPTSWTADADAIVAQKSPDTNYGSKSTLVTDSDPASSAYVRFTVPEVDGTVNRARLRLWATDGSANGPAAYPTSTTWSESSINWNNRPARSGGVLDDLGSVAKGMYAELDVSDVVTGAGTYSFELSPTSKDGTTFASSEASAVAQRPQLILDVASSDPEPTPEPEPVPEPEPEPQPLVHIGADADATVAQKSPDTNYGSKPTTLTDNDPVNRTFLRFVVSDVGGTVRGARLRLWVADGSGNGPSLYPSGTEWSESGITWNNRPARSGGVVGDLGSVASRTFVEIDVSAVVTGAGRYSFELASTSKDGTDFASREAPTSAQRPELILDVAPPTEVAG